MFCIVAQPSVTTTSYSHWPQAAAGASLTHKATHSQHVATCRKVTVITLPVMTSLMTSSSSSSEQWLTVPTCSPKDWTSLKGTRPTNTVRLCVFTGPLWWLVPKAGDVGHFPTSRGRHLAANIKRILACRNCVESPQLITNSLYYFLLNAFKYQTLDSHDGLLSAGQKLNTFEANLVLLFKMV